MGVQFRPSNSHHSSPDPPLHIQNQARTMQLRKDREAGHRQQKCTMYTSVYHSPKVLTFFVGSMHKCGFGGIARETLDHTVTRHWLSGLTLQAEQQVVSVELCIAHCLPTLVVCHMHRLRQQMPVTVGPCSEPQMGQGVGKSIHAPWPPLLQHATCHQYLHSVFETCMGTHESGRGTPDLRHIQTHVSK